MLHMQLPVRTSLSRLALVAILVFPLAGCSGSGKGRPKVVPVSGVVKFRGKPIANADVTFSTEGAPRFATGKTDAEGKYSLTTFDTNDGAVPGKQSVTVTMTTTATGGKKPEEMTAQDMINMGPRNNPVQDDVLPAKYANAKESGLVRTVVDGEQNVFNFDLE
jgi:hypothetical protein